VLGLSEYQSIFEVWQRICEERRPGFNAERGYTAPDEPDNAAIRWGTAFESSVIELAEARMGTPWTRIGCREEFWTVNGFGDESFFLRARGDDMPNYITCHIDGRYCDDQAGVFGPLHEGKTTSMMNFWDNWGTPGTDRVPQGYQVQAQHQTLCTGASEAIVSVLVFPRRVDEWEKEGITPDIGINDILDRKVWCLWRGIDPANYHPERVATCQEWASVISEMGLFHQYPVAASPTLQRSLVDAYSHFWHTYVLPEREPEIDSYKDIRRAFTAPVGTIVATEQEERWAAELSQIKDEIKPSGRLGRRAEELKVLLLKSMRAMDSQVDDESREKTVLRDRAGKKLASWDGKTFR
jgi:hypothetical protein